MWYLIGSAGNLPHVTPVFIDGAGMEHEAAQSLADTINRIIDVKGPTLRDQTAIQLLRKVVKALIWPSGYLPFELRQEIDTVLKAADEQADQGGVWEWVCDQCKPDAHNPNACSQCGAPRPAGGRR